MKISRKKSMSSMDNFLVLFTQEQTNSKFFFIKTFIWVCVEPLIASALHLTIRQDVP